MFSLRTAYVMIARPKFQMEYVKATIKVLDLEESAYSYQELISKLDEYLSSGIEDERLQAICGDCKWYAVSACWTNIKNKKYVV